MSDPLKFRITINREANPLLYDELCKVGYGRGRSEKIQLLASEYLAGRGKSIPEPTQKSREAPIEEPKRRSPGMNMMRSVSSFRSLD